MTSIHQVLIGAGQTDAITNIARNLQKVLSKIGSSKIYAKNIAPGVRDVLPLYKYKNSGSKNEVIIFHSSDGDPDIHKFLNAYSKTLVTIFHNIAPSESFEDIEPERAKRLQHGWQELKSIKSKISLSFADSPYNARCLEEIGYENIEILPVGIDANRLKKIDPCPAMSHRLNRETDGPLLLFVGQAVPHKQQETLIQMQYLLSHFKGIASSLVLVGPPTLPILNAAALEQARRLQVPNCLFLGQLKDSELATLYSRARIFVTASTHEGLCIPAIESMAFRTPVIARNCAALPETIGEAGILLPEKAGPEFFTEAVSELLENSSLYNQLSNKCEEVTQEYDIGRNEQKFLDALSKIL